MRLVPMLVLASMAFISIHDLGFSEDHRVPPPQKAEHANRQGPIYGVVAKRQRQLPPLSRLNEDRKPTQHELQIQAALEMTHLSDESPFKDARQRFRDRNDLLRDLILFVENTDPNMPGSDENLSARRLAAVVVLGNMRAWQAVPMLIENLDTISPLVRSDGMFGHPSPCVDALVNIGKPASTACLGALATEEDPIRRKRLLQVVKRVETPDVAKFMLAQAIENARLPEEKSKLELALSDLNRATGKQP